MDKDLSPLRNGQTPNPAYQPSHISELSVGNFTEQMLLNTVYERSNKFMHLLECAQQLSSAATDLTEYFKSFNENIKAVSKCEEKKALSKKGFLFHIDEGFANYNFKLESVGFPKQICKKRLFNFNVVLSELSENKISDQEEIPLIIEAWTSESKPVPICHNKDGEQFIQGTTNYLMKYHSRRKKFMAFVRIAITEVTSHFMNG